MLRLCHSAARPLLCFAPPCYRSDRTVVVQYTKEEMCFDRVIPKHARSADFRLCKVSRHITEIMEVEAETPTMHVLFIPGNPGIVTFYTEFIESLYELLEGTASITAIGHISHSNKDWEHGRLFSLQEQIEHKMDFIENELQNVDLPIILVGHSIGSYMSIEMFKRAPGKVVYCIGLYPFVALNRKSLTQNAIKKLTESTFLSMTVSSMVALFGFLPRWGSNLIVKKTLGRSWSATAVEAACSHLVKAYSFPQRTFFYLMNLSFCLSFFSIWSIYIIKYHTMRSMLFLAMTEFKELKDVPDYEFLKARQDQMSFLFGIDDHWGPLTLFEEISKEAPDISLTIEEEGHTHAFSCTEAGSRWVAEHVACLIKKYGSRTPHIMT